MSETANLSGEILEYLREKRGELVKPLAMVTELTSRISNRGESRMVRGRLLSCLTLLIREKKVIRYRKTSMINRRPRSSQGLVRISEHQC